MAGRVRGLALLGAACAPFAAGRALGPDGVGLPCPLRAATGIPCPLCGASRAFALAAGGDGDWTRYGGGWVVLAAALAVLGALALLRPGVLAAAQRVLALTTPRRAVLVLAVVAAGPWLWALSQRGALG